MSLPTSANCTYRPLSSRKASRLVHRRTVPLLAAMASASVANSAWCDGGMEARPGSYSGTSPIYSAGTGPAAPARMAMAQSASTQPLKVIPGLTRVDVTGGRARPGTYRHATTPASLARVSSSATPVTPVGRQWRWKAVNAAGSGP